MTMPILFLWPGFPDYAARCIGALRETGAAVEVVATRPSIPIEGMEASLGQKVYWIDGDSPTSLNELGVPRPRIVFVGGFFLRAFQSIAEYARDAGIPIVLMSDMNWTGRWRQRLADTLRYKLMVKPRPDGWFVPGKAGRRYARAMGWADECIFEGLYAADPFLFHGGPALIERPMRIQFVGQFIGRKGVIPLIEAFIRVAGEAPEWELHLCGSGPLQDNLPRHERVIVDDFMQPRELAAKLRQARLLALPSREEHWGVVVHEAVSCGCALLLSEEVGAAADFSAPANSRRFPFADRLALEKSLRTFFSWEKDDWNAAEAYSRTIAAVFSPDVFAQQVRAISAHFSLAATP